MSAGVEVRGVRKAHPIGKGCHEVETPGGGSVTTDDGTGALVVRLPSWVTAATWASCTHCHAVRRTSKYRPAGILTCGNCGQARNHVTEHPALWAERAAWLIKLFRTAGVELLVGELAPMTVGRPGPAAVAVACFEFDEPNPVGPLDGIRVTLHEDLTPGPAPRASIRLESPCQDRELARPRVDHRSHLGVEPTRLPRRRRRGAPCRVPGGGVVSGAVEVRDCGDVLEVRLPSWLTDDERRAIVEQLDAFFATAVEAVRR